MCLSWLWWRHLNINKASALFCGEETQIQGALTKDFPVYIQKNRVLATSLSIFIWCRMLRMRFNKVAQRLWSQVSLQSFHILSKSERKVWGIAAERETWWREGSEGVFLSAVVCPDSSWQYCGFTNIVILNTRVSAHFTVEFTGYCAWPVTWISSGNALYQYSSETWL